MLSHKVDLRGSTNVTSPHAIRAPPTISLFHDLVQTHQNENEKSRSVHPMLMYTMASIKVPAWSALIFSRCPSVEWPRKGSRHWPGKVRRERCTHHVSLTLNMVCDLSTDPTKNPTRSVVATAPIKSTWRANITADAGIWLALSLPWTSVFKAVSSTLSRNTKEPRHVK